MEEPCFARTRIADDAQIRQFVEAVVNPGKEDVVAGNHFKKGAEIDVAVDEGTDFAKEIGLGPVLFNV